MGRGRRNSGAWTVLTLSQTTTNRITTETIPWINNQDPSIDKTEENDKVQQEEPNDSATSETADNKNPFEANDTTELPQIEPEKAKKHTVRNILIGGIAVIAAVTLATSIADKSSSETQVNPITTSQEQSQNAAEGGSSDIEDGSSYNFNDGLLAKEVSHDYLTAQGTIDSLMASDYINDWMGENGYSATEFASVSYELDTPAGDALFGVYDDDDERHTVCTIFYKMASDGSSFNIRISVDGGYYYDPDREDYEFTSYTIPTAEEAAKIAENELINN